MSAIQSLPQNVNILDGPWIMSVPVISTAHLPADVYQRLAEIMEEAHMATMKGGCGDLLCIDENDLDEKEDPELFAVVSYFRGKGYDYLRFDADGDVIGDLPVWDW